MAALTQNNAALMVKDGAKVSRLARASTEVFSGSFVMRDSDGNVRPVITSVAGIFEGIGAGYVGTDTTLYPTGSINKRRVEITKKGSYKIYISGLAATDVGKPVWCITDNPADVTLTYAAGYHCVGKVDSLEYTATGALSGYAWVIFDTELPLSLTALPRGMAEGLKHFSGGIEYWNDFIGPMNAGWSATAGAAAWLETRVDGDVDGAQVIKLTDSEPDGTLTITTNNKTADIESLQLNGAPFTPGSTAVVYFEARVKFTTATTSKMLIGMCARGGARYTASGGGFFFRKDADAHLDCVSELSTTEDETSAVGDLVDATYVKLGILYELGASVKFYLNGTLVATTTDTTKIVTAVDLVPTIELWANTSAVSTMTVDYVLVRMTPRV